MGSHVIPTFSYRDAPAMIDWLCAVFGFERRAIHEEAGRVLHAELTLDDGMIMIGTLGAGAPELCAIQKSPEELGATTQSPYLVVADADAVHARAVERGAEIVLPLSDKPYGSRDFSCRDPEGHLWHVGTYDPWAPAA